MNLVQYRKTHKRSILFFIYDVTMSTEQTYFTYSSADMEFVGFHFWKFPGQSRHFFYQLPLNHNQFLWKGSHAKDPTVAFQKDKLIMNHMQYHWYYVTEFGSKDILSIRIQCGEFTALSKWLPDTSPLVRIILHSVGLSITMRWPQFLCKPHTTHLVMCLSKSCVPTRNILWIWNLIRHGQPLTGCSALTGPPCRKSLLPVNNAFFIAMAIIVKGAADTPDCQGLGDIWENNGLYAFLRAPTRCHPLTAPYFNETFGKDSKIWYV